MSSLEDAYCFNYNQDMYQIPDRAMQQDINAGHAPNEQRNFVITYPSVPYSKLQRIYINDGKQEDTYLDQGTNIVYI